MRYRWSMLAGLVLLAACIIMHVFFIAAPSLPQEAVSPANLGMMLLDNADGVSVLAVQDGSAAERAGIRPTDLLMRLNGTPFNSTEELERLLQSPIEADICLYLIRSGHEMEISIPIVP